MSKGRAKTVETRQDTSPWAAQQPYLQNLFSRADSLYSSGTPTVAPQSSYTQQAIKGLSSGGGGGGGGYGMSSLTKTAEKELEKTLRGGYSNPYVKEALGDVIDMTRSKINAQFLGDNDGSSVHKEWLGRGVAAAGHQFASQFYENERGRQMSAAGMAPSYQAQRTAATQAQQAAAQTKLMNQVLAGQMQDAYQQRVTDSPWEALQRYQGYVGGNYGGSTTGTQPYQRSNPFADIAGLAMVGKTIFSDRRLKREVERIGTHPIGVPLYSFKYLNDDIPRIGVMADEVKGVMPEAVGERDGYLTVNYEMLEIANV